MNKKILEQLNWRYAVQKFDPTRKISSEEWHVLLESLRLSPSSYGLQPWKFIIVQDPDLRLQLKAASWNQSQVVDCSHLIVMIYKTKMDEQFIQKFVDSVSITRGVPLESLERFKGGMIRDLINGPRAQQIAHWAQRQTYIAMGMLMATAATMGIDTCPMEGLDPDKYDKILNVEEGWDTVAAIPCGYRHPEDPKQFLKKVRFPPEDVFIQM